MEKLAVGPEVPPDAVSLDYTVKRNLQVSRCRFAALFCLLASEGAILLVMCPLALT